MDYFVFASLAFVFLAFVETLLTCTLAARGWEIHGRRIDQWARLAFPLAFVMVSTWFWRS